MRWYNQLYRLLSDYSFFLLLLLILPFIRITPFYSHNQNTYFVKGYFNAGHLLDDWFANQKSVMVEFDTFIALVLKFFPGNPELIFQFIFICFLVVCIYGFWTNLNYFTNKKNTFFTLLLCCTIFFTVLPTKILPFFDLPSQFTYLFYNGLAGHNLISYLQPSIVGVFLLFGIYYYLNERLVISAIVFLFLSILHPSNILFAFLAMFIISFDLVKAQNWKKFIKIILSGIPFLLILLWKHIGLVYSHDPEIQRMANDILIFDRSPHHHVVGQWIMSEAEWIKIAWLFVGFLIFKGRLFRFYTFIICSVLILTVIQYLTDSQFLSMLSPWRLTSVWIPLVTIFFVSRALSIFRSTQKIRVLAVFGLILVGLNTVVKLSSPHEGLHIKKNKNLASLNGVVLIPPKGDWGEKSENIRLNYLLPVFVDFKSHPYDAKGLIEWKERIKLAESFYKSPNRGNLDFILERQKIDYLIWPKKSEVDLDLNFDIVTESKWYIIFKVS